MDAIRLLLLDDVRKVEVLPPMEVSGLQLWLKADAITGLSDGDPIASWADQSGEGNNAVQATAAKKPLYKTDVVNGEPVVRFDGTDDTLVIPHVAGLNTETFTLFIVMAFTNEAADETIFEKWDQSGAYPYAFRTRVDGNVRFATYDGSAANNMDGDTDISDGSFNILTFVRDGTDGEIFLNGVSDGDTSTHKENTTNTHDVGIGARGVGGTPWGGDTAEIIFYNEELSSADKDTIETYLSEKYNITLP